MQSIIEKIESYRQELVDYEVEVQRGVQSSLPLIDITLDTLRGLSSGECPFCSAIVYPIDEIMQMIEAELNGIFDLPETWPAGGFVNELSWIKSQDESMYCGAKTEWFCSECRTGKLLNMPGEGKFRFRWDRQNLPKSKRAIASRIFEQYPLITEMALAGDAINTWYILYDDDWYVSLAGDEIFVEKWGLVPRELSKPNGPIPGYVYLLRCQDMYKIGRTTQKPEDRAAQLDTAIPLEITLIHSIKVADCNTAEKDLHSKFSDKRWKGEWFKLDAADVAYIKGLGESHG